MTACLTPPVSRLISCTLLIFFVLETKGQTGAVDAQTAKQLGAGYAALVNFAENPDITTATYRIDYASGDDLTLRTVRFGGEHVFRRESRSWQPFVGIHLFGLTYEATFELDSTGAVYPEWTTLGAILMPGLKISITTECSVRPAAALGLVRVENDTAYSGSATNLQPILDGVLFNWTSDALLTGMAFKADYRRAVGSDQLYLYGRATHNLIETYRSSRGSVEFSSHATTLALKAELTHPTDLKISNYPLAIIGLLGGTTFAGPNRDELGFEYFLMRVWPLKQTSPVTNGSTENSASAPKPYTEKTWSAVALYSHGNSERMKWGG